MKTLNQKLKAIPILLFFMTAFFIIPVATTTTINSYAVGDVDISITDGKLSVSGGGMAHKDSDDAWNNLIKKYRGFIVGVSGIGAVSMILFFISCFMKLGATASNPQERAKVIQGLVWSALAAAGLGAVTIIVGFFYSALKE